MEPKNSTCALQSDDTEVLQLRTKPDQLPGGSNIARLQALQKTACFRLPPARREEREGCRPQADPNDSKAA
jgi:hypothetical protein